MQDSSFPVLCYAMLALGCYCLIPFCFVHLSFEKGGEGGWKGGKGRRGEAISRSIAKTAVPFDEMRKQIIAVVRNFGFLFCLRCFLKLRQICVSVPDELKQSGESQILKPSKVLVTGWMGIRVGMERGDHDVEEIAELDIKMGGQKWGGKGGEVVYIE